MSETPTAAPSNAPANVKQAATPAKASAVADETSRPIPIDEFCKALSVTDSRVELISGFHKYMEFSGKVSLLQDEFVAEFDKFTKMPV